MRFLSISLKSKELSPRVISGRVRESRLIMNTIVFIENIIGLILVLSSGMLPVATIMLQSKARGYKNRLFGHPGLAAAGNEQVKHRLTGKRGTSGVPGVLGFKL